MSSLWPEKSKHIILFTTNIQRKRHVCYISSLSVKIKILFLPIELQMHKKIDVQTDYNEINRRGCSYK